MRLDSLMQDLALQAQQGASRSAPSDPAHAYFDNTTAPRVHTETYMVHVLRKEYPTMTVTSVAESLSGNLLDFANSTDKATYRPLIDSADPLSVPVTTKIYVPPARRTNGPGAGRIVDRLVFGKYEYKHRGATYILYACSGRDGMEPYPQSFCQFLVHPPTEQAAQGVTDLIQEAGKWGSELHDEMWVFDQGYWQKDANLLASVKKARWQDVILDEREKTAIQDDARRFFSGRERYEKLRVPWKRGVIYYGPPGNGKTISIKALSSELYRRKDSVPTLYVKTLSGFGGPEYSIKQIFAKARAEAPCLLVFEDLDSMITDRVRSYFLNEVDGLTTNEGVMMIGSTNHLERLDPGISKRPSRFDRKFEFPKPDLDQRIAYCEYWRGKLEDNEEIEFPKELSPAIAKITDKFSFAYLQEAFVAALLAIAFEGGDGAGCASCRTKEDDLDRYILWRVIKKQIKILRDEL